MCTQVRNIFSALSNLTKYIGRRKIVNFLTWYTLFDTVLQVCYVLNSKVISVFDTLFSQKISQTCYKLLTGLRKFLCENVKKSRDLKNHRNHFFKRQQGNKPAKKKTKKILEVPQIRSSLFKVPNHGSNSDMGMYGVSILFSSQ